MAATTTKKPAAKKAAPKKTTAKKPAAKKAPAKKAPAKRKTTLSQSRKTASTPKAAAKAPEFNGEYTYAVGRRKASSARVRLYKGSGRIFVNGIELANYFGRADHQARVTFPLSLIADKDGFDVSARVVGGGITGQADAIRLGIARALVKQDETLHVTFKKRGLLTRDARKKERKKYGLKSARRAPQWSKR